jgi:SAM-dependent methyltransferase
MYAVSLDLGTYFPRWDGYELLNFEHEYPNFDGRVFDAILCAHFIEHLKDPERCIRWMAHRLRPGGRVYLEWPHSVSKRMPSSSTVRGMGLSVSTINFFDDRTHVETWEMVSICDTLQRNGLIVEAVGRIHYPFLAAEMRDICMKSHDPVHGTFSIWGFCGWAQYIAASKHSYTHSKAN